MMTGRQAISAAAIGNVLEWYDFAIYAYAASIIGRRFFPEADELTSLLAVFATFGVGFVVRPLGGFVIGRMADLRSRKSALLLTMFLMAVGTVGIGALPDHHSIGSLAPVLLVLCRLLQGFSAGGEWGSSTAFIVEWAPSGKRGLYGSLQQSSVSGGLLLGSVVTALLNTLLTPDQMDAWGWRIPFLTGSLLLPAGLYMRRNISEPPSFRRARPNPELKPTRAGLLLAAKACGFTVLWTVSYYAMLSYMPTFTQRFAGLSAAQALWSNAFGLVALVVSIPAFGALSDRIGRKPLLLASCIAFMSLSYPLFLILVSGAPMTVVVLVQVTFALMIALFSGPGPAAIAEIFHTADRSTWMSAGYSIAVAVFGGFAPFIVTWLIGITGSLLAPTYYLIAAAMVSALVIAELRETAHHELR
jgi:MHS family proline/betaine transporter-like MFS transporter